MASRTNSTIRPARRSAVTSTPETSESHLHNVVTLTRILHRHKHHMNDSSRNRRVHGTTRTTAATAAAAWALPPWSVRRRPRSKAGPANLLPAGVVGQTGESGLKCVVEQIGRGHGVGEPDAVGAAVEEVAVA